VLAVDAPAPVLLEEFERVGFAMVTKTGAVRDSRHTKANPESEPVFVVKSQPRHAPERNARTRRHCFIASVSVEDGELRGVAICTL
jgi:hypothetical protein